MTVFRDNFRLLPDIFSFLQNNPSGEVLLTTSKGVYLQFSSRILLLTLDKYGIIPNGLSLSRFADFLTEISPKPGQRVAISDGVLHFPGGDLAGIWNISEPVRSLGVPLPQQVNFCADKLVTQCSQRSLANLTDPLLRNRSPVTEDHPHSTRALPLLHQLLQALRNTGNVETPVRQLLGLGLGLTPSCDDILLGMLYGLLRFAPQEASTAALRQTILTYAPSHTNAISAAYLTAVAQGEYYELLDQQLLALCSKTPIDIQPILQVGSSSGSEMLLGLLLAAHIHMKG